MPLFDDYFFLFFVTRVRVLCRCAISVCLYLLVDDKVSHFFHFGHEASLAVIEIVKEQTQVFLMLLLHRVENLGLADFNPDLVLCGRK